MPRISNVRTIADIEFVINAPSAGSDQAAWKAHGVDCSRDRHRFSSQTYSFSFELVHLRSGGSARAKWYVVIVTERCRFPQSRTESRTTKPLKVIYGRQADVLSWMRRSREAMLPDRNDRDASTER
jgi:hypothetical protein